jgi:hypothetical protein
LGGIKSFIKKTKCDLFTSQQGAEGWNSSTSLQKRKSQDDRTWAHAA